MRISIISDNSGYYITGSSYGTGRPVVWKYILAHPADENWYRFVSFKQFARSSIFVNDKIFFIAIDSVNPFPLHMLRYTFGASSSDWSVKTVCTGATWIASASEGLISNDGSKIYTFYINILL